MKTLKRWKRFLQKKKEKHFCERNFLNSWSWCDCSLSQCVWLFTSWGKIRKSFIKSFYALSSNMFSLFHKLLPYYKLNESHKNHIKINFTSKFYPHFKNIVWKYRIHFFSGQDIFSITRTSLFALSCPLIIFILTIILTHEEIFTVGLHIPVFVFSAGVMMT